MQKNARENKKDERKNIPCVILYVVSVCISREILEENKVGRYGPDGNQFSRKKPINAIKC